VAFTGGGEQKDDVTLVVVKRLSGESRSSFLSVIQEGENPHGSG